MVKNWLISKISIIPKIPGNPDANPPVPDVAAIQITGANDNTKILEKIKQGFKRKISWKKYWSEIATQIKENNLNYLIDPIFTNISRLFVLSFKNGNDDLLRDSFNKYYRPLAKIKDFDELIDNKQFFQQPVKNKQEGYEKLIEMLRRNNGYATRNILDYLYHQNYYELIGIHLSRQTNTIIPQQINFTGKLEEDDGAAMIFVSEKEQKTIRNFPPDSLIVTELYK